MSSSFLSYWWNDVTENNNVKTHQIIPYFRRVSSNSIIFIVIIIADCFKYVQFYSCIFLRLKCIAPIHEIDLYAVQDFFMFCRCGKFTWKGIFLLKFKYRWKSQQDPKCQTRTQIDFKRGAPVLIVNRIWLQNTFS